MKRIARIVCTLLALATVAACTLSFAACGKKADDLETVRKNGKLVVGITEFAPMDYRDADKNWIGFDADAASAFAAYLGVEVEFSLIDWDRKTFELEAGTIDCVWNGMTLTDDVKAAMSTSKPYFNKRYNSVELVDNILFFLIFFFGISNASSFGTEYMAALNFVALITDCQWDSFDAIQTVANIDISQGKFNYKEHIKNAYKLLMILLSSVFLMFIILYHSYSLNMKLVFIYFAFELVNFVIYPIYRIHTCYLQLEYSSMKTTVNKTIASVFRFILSLLPTPFCTGIGQVCSSIYQFISTNVMFGKNYKVDNLGNITLKEGEELL